MSTQEIKNFAAISAINAAVQSEVASLEGMKVANKISHRCKDGPPKYREEHFHNAAKKLNELAKMLEEFS